MSYVSGPIAWRLPLAMQIVFSLIEKVSVLGVPESPRWLFTVGRQHEAIRLLALSTGEAEDSAVVQEQTAEIKQALELEEIGNQTTWKKMFTQDSVCTRERVLLAFGCHVSMLVRGKPSQTNLSAVHEPNGWHQPRRLLHPLCPRPERRYDTETGNHFGRMVSQLETSTSRSSTHMTSLQYQYEFDGRLGFPKFHARSYGQTYHSHVGHMHGWRIHDVYRHPLEHWK